MTQEDSCVRHVLQRLERISKASVNSMHAAHFFSVVHLVEQCFTSSVIAPCPPNFTISSSVQGEVCEMYMPTGCHIGLKNIII